MTDLRTFTLQLYDRPATPAPGTVTPAPSANDRLLAAIREALGSDAMSGPAMDAIIEQAAKAFGDHEDAAAKLLQDLTIGHGAIRSKLQAAKLEQSRPIPASTIIVTAGADIACGDNLVCEGQQIGVALTAGERHAADIAVVVVRWGCVVELDGEGAPHIDRI